MQGAGGLYTIDGQTQHTTMDMHIVRGNRDQSFDVIKSFPQRPPKDTQLVCDLIRTRTTPPNTSRKSDGKGQHEDPAKREAIELLPAPASRPPPSASRAGLFRFGKVSRKVGG